MGDDACDVTEIAPTELQFLLWGYAVTGNACETDALIAEQGYLFSGMLWDQRASYLENSWITDEKGDRHPPEHWCLPWVSEWRRRAALAGSAGERRD